MFHTCAGICVLLHRYDGSEYVRRGSPEPRHEASKNLPKAQAASQLMHRM